LRRWQPGSRPSSRTFHKVQTRGPFEC
jgi:hypothetical protein